MNTPPDSTLPRPSGQPRRRWLTWIVGAAAVITGAGLAWRQTSLTDSQNDIKMKESADFWDMHFATPSGKDLTMQAFRGKPLLLNFWATWCPPCVEELPLLERFFQENSVKGWQVIGLAIDKADAVQRFIQKMPLSFPIGMGGTEGADIGRALGNMAGALPFTVVFNATGSIVHRKMGTLNADELQALIKAFST